jgi:hypothetical protein
MLKSVNLHAPLLSNYEHAETSPLHLSHKRLRRILSGDRFDVGGGQVYFLGDWVFTNLSGPDRRLRTGLASCIG